MTYTKLDPRYDYRKLDAFITGVNNVVPVQKRLLVKSMREDILLWAFPFARPIQVMQVTGIIIHKHRSLGATKMLTQECR
jgi:hypothetical protein